MSWCDFVAWSQLVGLALDGVGVIILTIDILPDFNDYRARGRVAALGRKLDRLIRSGQDALRTPADPQGYSSAAIDSYDALVAASYMAAATGLDIEELQTDLRRIYSAWAPLGFLGERDPIPTDLVGIYRRYQQWEWHFAHQEGDHVRLPLYWAILALLVGFLLQAVGSLPDGVWWTCGV